MRITQGTFSFLPDLTDAQITRADRVLPLEGWAVSVEYTDDPHPRNTYWEMYGNPMFDLKDAAGVMDEVDACRKSFPDHYMKVNAFDSTPDGRPRAFVHREPPEGRTRVRAGRQEATGALAAVTPRRSYATEKPEGQRYSSAWRGAA